MKLIPALFALISLAVFAAVGAGTPPNVQITELPYGPDEGLKNRRPLMYASSAELKQWVPLDGVRRIVFISAGRREARLSLVDSLNDEVRIDGLFVRRVSGYHGTVAEDFEWRSKTNEDVAFRVNRENASRGWLRTPGPRGPSTNSHRVSI